MFDKQIIREVFDNEFDSEKMKRQILVNYERKERKKMFKVLKYVVPVCVITLICGIMFFKDNSSNVKYYNDLVINKIDDLGAYRFDADIKPVNGLFVEWNVLLNDIKIPSDLDKLDAYGIYTRKDKIGEYDILNCYVYDYYKDNSLRNIKVSFSDLGKPIRDYYFSEEDVTKSIINNYEVLIYQYKEIYFTEFKYKGYYFDIETSNITIKELETLLTSIIK